MKLIDRAALTIILFFPLAAHSTTVTESWDFDALFEDSFFEEFLRTPVTPTTTRGYVIQRGGLEVGETYRGRLALEFDTIDNSYTSLSCAIGTYDCALGSFSEFALQNRLPSGPEAFFQTGDGSQSSIFRFGLLSGSYQYLDEALQPSRSEFSLSNITYSVRPTVSAVPVPATLPLLLLGILGLGAVRHTKRRA